MKLEGHLWVGCFRKRNAFLFFRWLFFFSMKLTCFPLWCPGFSMPLVSLSSPICSCCPWWEMETLRNFSSNLSYLGLKPMLVDNWECSVWTVPFTNRTGSQCISLSCHFWLLVVNFTSLPSDSCLALSSPDPSQLPSLFPCLHFQRHTWSPLGLHSHDENTHYCISRQFPKMCVVLSDGWWQAPSLQDMQDSQSLC